MTSLQRLVIADSLIKSAVINPGLAALLGGFGTPVAAGAGQKMQGGSWGDAARMFGRSGVEGAGGTVAGGGLGLLGLMALSRKVPPQSIERLLLGLAAAPVVGAGAGLGGMAGGAHGAYAAARNAQERHSLGGTVKRMLGQ